MDENDWEELRCKNESKRTATPQSRKAKKPKPEPTLSTQYDNKQVFNAHRWDFEATVSDKYKIISEVRDVTTLNMRHVCVSISFFLIDNESYKPPTDGQETHGVELLISKTPGKRRVTTINSLLVEDHTLGGHKPGQRILA
jgi:hypothetical protein